MNMYSAKFQNFQDAVNEAVRLAEESGKTTYVSCSSGWSVVTTEKVFPTAGYYEAAPSGHFGWAPGLASDVVITSE